ncbi:MAG: hypothetical protein H6631_10550 [Anaerolineaceae bacterium]|nr:hypothetical protein [Anaerolineaceae bacterium]
MASRKLTPGSYVVFVGLMLLALVVAVVSFIIPFTILSGASPEGESVEAETETLPTDIDLKFTPEAPANAEAAKAFQDKILNSYIQVDVPEATVEPTTEPTVEATEEATAEATEEPTVEATQEATVEPTEEATQ